MHHIGIVHNPNARKNRNDPGKAGRLADILGTTGVVRETRNNEDIVDVAREFLKNKVKFLGINGGDGTQHQVLSRFIRVYKDTPLPPIIHLRGGTMNTLANGFGVWRTSTEQILGTTVKKIRANENFHTIEREIMEIHDLPSRDGKLYGFLFGGGLISSFLEAYYEGGETGPKKAAVVAYQTVSSALLGTDFAAKLMSPVEATASVDGVPLPFEKLTVFFAAAIKTIGLGFKAAYRAGEIPRHFHVILGDPTPLSIALRLHRLYRGVPFGIPRVHDAAHRSLTLTPKNSFSYTIDGDLYTTTAPVTISTGPRLTLITG